MLIKIGYNFGYNYHCLPNSILFAIKHLQLTNAAGKSNLKPIFTLYAEHPEFFRGSCVEFERICHKEYDAIAQQHKELDVLIREQTDKKDYYVSLERQIQQIEKREDQLKNERQKLLEEKRQLFLVKQKLSFMEADIKKEKEKLEEGKARREMNRMNLDEYFQEIMNEIDEEN
jgi:septal ring factor EnvC (AmiA/AmiB activator)